MSAIILSLYTPGGYYVKPSKSVTDPAPFAFVASAKYATPKIGNFLICWRTDLLSLEPGDMSTMASRNVEVIYYCRFSLAELYLS